MKPASQASLRQDEMGVTSQSAFSQQHAGASSLKGKLQGLEEHIKSVTEELNFHKKEVSVLKTEKDTLEKMLHMKLADARKSLGNEIFRVEEEMKRHFQHQKAENSRLQQQITVIKGEKTALQQQLLALQRRISELELQVGQEDS